MSLPAVGELVTGTAGVDDGAEPEALDVLDQQAAGVEEADPDAIPPDTGDGRERTELGS